MKDYFEKYLSGDDWLIHEDKWDPKWQAVRETQFTLGNGWLGSRGVLEELPYDSYSGTYIANIFDKTAAQVTELANVPNPVVFAVASDGEKLDVVGMDVLKHKRILDIKQGLLYRKTLYSNSKKQRFLYQSLRFFSMQDKGVGVMRIYITPLDASANLTVMSRVDTSVTNKGVLTEGRKRHFLVHEVQNLGDSNYACVRTLEKSVLVAYASSLEVAIGKKKYKTGDVSFPLRLKKRQTVKFTKIFAINTSCRENIKEKTIEDMRKSVKIGFDKLVAGNAKAWDEKWNVSDIKMGGDPETTKTMRFNIYHLLICCPEDEVANIGAKTLSGEGYRGHIFWDSEIFILPFYLYTNPVAARNMLLYRYERLSAAREIAKRKGYKGTMFPWESADTGFDATPTWYKNFDGSIIRIYTMQREHHITSDIAYAVMHYYTATKDEKFLLEYGLEMIFECARFWASRVEYKKKKKIYEINNVIGPDEFHEDVNNNAYTNVMAIHTLDMAVLLYNRYRRKRSAIIKTLSKRINLTEKEPKEWINVVSKMRPIIPKENKLIEQFDGYFKRKDVRITSLDNNLMPMFPKELKLKEIGKTQLVKQADVVMLLYLLGDLFDLKTKKNNYKYYSKRTLHKSSLSPSIHAIMGAEIGDYTRAYQYFLISACADLRNVHGNTVDGIHAASCGGTWQALINGFGGMRVKRGSLFLNPKLPSHWKSLSFNIKWHGYNLSVVAYRDRIRLRFISKNKTDKLRLRVYNSLKELSANKWSIFSKTAN